MVAGSGLEDWGVVISVCLGVEACLCGFRKASLARRCPRLVVRNALAF